jgi:hypothetical protein
MLNVVQSELLLLDLKLNASKSVCLRIGRRYNAKCIKIKIGSETVPWVAEAKYLGLYVKSSIKFSCNFETAKAKFYRSSNAILSRLGNQPNPCVALQLISSIALPSLTYSAEALNLNTAHKTALGHPWDRTFMKIFKTFDRDILKQCQYYGGFLPVSYMLDIRTVSFVEKLSKSTNKLLKLCTELNHDIEINSIARKYDVDIISFKKNYKNIILNAFCSNI